MDSAARGFELPENNGSQAALKVEIARLEAEIASLERNCELRIADLDKRLHESQDRVRELAGYLTPRESDLPQYLRPPTFLDTSRLPSLGDIIPQEKLPFKKLRVCIVTQDIFGPIRNGGIGTAFGHVADFLAKQGHDVTVLYTLGNHCEQGEISDWIRYYADKGITFIPAVRSVPPLSPRYRQSILKHARDAYETLKKLPPFDLVHVSEWAGNGYLALQAKRMGLAFSDTIFCVKTSSPSLWGQEGNNVPVSDVMMLHRSHYEQKSVEWADLVISPSRHMLSWMAEHGYDLPRERLVVNPNIMPLPDDWETIQNRPRYLHQIKEVVFFGRFELRKGIDIFSEAITLLKRDNRLPPDIAITFLGKKALVYDFDRALQGWKKEWGLDVTVITDRDAEQAVAYLKGTGRLAVVPSRLDNSPFTIYECLAHRIAFLTTDRGGTPELVCPEDRSRLIFPPRPAKLAQCLAQAFAEGVPIGRPSFDFEQNLDDWARFHVALAHRRCVLLREQPRIEMPSSDEPLVSVCVATYNRPALLCQALDSLRAQPYKNLEVIVIDDGSTDLEAIGYLEGLKDEFAQKNWKIIRQENQYLGAVRNTGSRHAAGEYLLLMDDDNIAFPRAVETFVACAKHTGADIVTCFSYVLDGLEFPDNTYTSPAMIPYLGEKGKAC